MSVCKCGSNRCFNTETGKRQLLHRIETKPCTTCMDWYYESVTTTTKLQCECGHSEDSHTLQSKVCLSGACTCERFKVGVHQPINSPAQAFVKHDDDKPMFDLIPPEVELEVAKAFTHGAKTYSPNNYRLGTRWGRYIAATRRHLNAWQRGVDNDTGPKGSGLNHLAHAIASLSMLLTLQLTGAGEDDRPRSVEKVAK